MATAGSSSSSSPASCPRTCWTKRPTSSSRSRKPRLPYLVHSPEERAEMLAAIGVDTMDGLLVDIPSSLRIPRLELPDGLSEFETMAQVTSLAAKNRVFADRLTFRGGGVYRRFIPAAVAAVTGKPEFYTAYTPYQPEASQGTLQAIYEFQTLIAELTALDVANASLYDGATAVAEAAMMASVQTGRKEVLVAGYVHPEYVEVLRAFSDGRGIKVKKGSEPNAKTAAVIFQQPDFLGLLVDAPDLTRRAHDVGALAIACVDPVSLAVLAPPGEYGADIAVGEGQQLGLSPSYGGPHVGFIASRKDLVRRLPGRLIGSSHDAQGRRGFVLTLTAREQHIRREKATSNICTNHSLCALAASVYMTYMGPRGMRQVAEVSFKRAHSLAERLAAIPGWEPAFPDRQFVNEFPMRVANAPALVRRLARKGILGPLQMNRWFRELKGVV